MSNPGHPHSFAASSLSHFLECSERTRLDLLVAAGTLARPGQNEIERELLARRGLEHERLVLEGYRAAGKHITELTPRPDAAGRAQGYSETLAAMAAGSDVIYQGVLVNGGWSGRPDFLLKVPGASRDWPHHYEAVDAKLAHSARAAAVLQLCVYTDQLAALLGKLPEHLHIAPGGSAEPIALRAADYMAYYRALQQRFEAFASGGSAEQSYPEPVEHCGVCPWWKRCEDRRRADDHLSLVAGITRRQRDRLATAGIETLSALARLARGTQVADIAPGALERVREQAELQAEARDSGKHRLRLLRDEDRAVKLLRDATAAQWVGLEALPSPTPGDLFLDLEGDAFVAGGGLEYLFGLVELGEPSFDFIQRTAAGPPRYHAYWAEDAASEKVAFQRVIERIRKGRAEFPALHVFHFGHREADALKKLACRHKTHEEVVDQLLREHVLVDLYPVVRQGLRASVEGYTLKQLEVLHGFTRAVDLRQAARAMQLFGWWLETRDTSQPLPELKGQIEAYNREDCLSTYALRDWLEARRSELEQLEGKKLARPPWEAATLDGEKAQKHSDAAALASRLTEDVTLAPSLRAAHQLMADLLEWHWREAKSSWWDYHRARELAPDERIADRAALGGLEYVGAIGKEKRSTIHRYTFPEQEHAIRPTPGPIDPETEKSAGTVVELGAHYIDLKRDDKSFKRPHPRALIPGKPIATDAQEGSLLDLGRAIAAGTQHEPPFRVAWQLLTRTPPQLGQAPGAPLVAPDEPIESALRRLALALDGSVLAIQGPPGSGKTYQAARMIGALVAAGKRVGVTANSHAVIQALLSKTKSTDTGLRVLRIDDEANADDFRAAIEVCEKDKAASRLNAREVDVLGGTSWAWSDSDFVQSVDVLVVDEAGQMSLANVLAIARAARSLVLVGDPAQLEQPQRGVHPPGADVSALEHLLGGDALTLPPELGVFLPDTRRLHPHICSFVSSVFYESRLHPITGLERQAIAGPGILHGAGLRYVPVDHRGNTNQSTEEVEVIRRLITELAAAHPSFIDQRGEARPLRIEDDVLVVAPYNAQVAALRRALPPEMRIGTVDKFQGRQAPVVFYSLTSSSAQEAPKGLEFLYSLNRLNVAVSRAQALCVLVGSPELTRVACKTPRQMKLVNGLCAYLELASRP
jgi:predicted RecB family nuclease